MLHPGAASRLAEATAAARYAALVAAGAVDHDPAQAAIAERLDALAHALTQRRRPARQPALGRLFGRRRPPAAPRGLYLHGDVGRGKTMLVDLFFDTVALPAKRRAHFNDFMADVHERVHDFRQRLKRGTAKGDDPIPPVADAIAAESELLCLDELHVDDIADAMILGRLFAALFARGLVAVATSNVPPGALYAHGLNRALFLPFVALVKERMEVVLLDAATDYRLDKLRGGGTWFAPAGPEADAAMDAAWRRFAGAEAGEPATLAVKGRTLTVPHAHMGVARLGFAELCEAPLGPNDYLALARAFHTVLIDRIPVLRANQRNATRRFVLAIDTLYDNRVKLIASAEGEPEALYRDGPLAGEFRRTASRLHEMRSEAYLALPHGAGGRTPPRP